MRKVFPKVLIVITIIGIVNLLIIISIFFIKGHVNPKDEIDASYLSGFGSILSGTVGTLLSISTIILVWLTYDSQKAEAQIAKELVKKQMELSLKADIFIANSFVYGYSMAAGQGTKRRSYPDSFSSTKLTKDDLNGRIKPFSDVYINIINVGVGVAKNIQVNWQTNQEASEKFYLNKVEDENVELAIGPKRKDTVDYKDYLLPIKDKENIYQSMIPYDYLKLYFLTLNASRESKNNINISNDRHFRIKNFPKCQCGIKYTDMADNVQEKKFEILFSGNGTGVIGFSGGGEIADQQILNFEISAQVITERD